MPTHQRACALTPLYFHSWKGGLLLSIVFISLLYTNCNNVAMVYDRHLKLLCVSKPVVNKSPRGGGRGQYSCTPIRCSLC